MVYAPRGVHARARNRRRVAARLPVGAAAPVRVLDGVPSGRVLDPLRARRAAHARQLRARLGGRAVRALLPQHGHPGDDGAGGAARAGHARRLRVRALRVPGPQRAVRAGAGAAHGDARRADRRELPHDDHARPQGHDPGDRPAVHGERASASSCCARRSRPCRASSTRPRASKAARRCRCCGRCTCRSRGRRISPTRW